VVSANPVNLPEQKEPAFNPVTTVVPASEEQNSAAQKADVANGGGLPFRTLKELNADPEEEHEYLVEGMLPLAGSSILHGKPKKGKSSISRQLALAVSRGEPFLGRQTVQGLVMYIALEEKPSEIKRHFRLLGADDDPILILTDLRGCKLEQVRQEILLKRPVLVIVDTLAKFLNISKINDYGPVNKAVQWIHDVARESGAHIMAIHHSKKGTEEDVTDNMLGSTALAGGVDTLISLADVRGGRIISTTQRYGDWMEETALQFDPETRSVRLGNTTKSESEETRRRSREVLSHAIIAFVTHNPGCIESEILANVTGKRETTKMQLRELLKERLRRTGGGRAGDPYLYYADVPVES
jgi:hypothetical protein